MNYPVAQVVVDVRIRDVDRVFDYAVPLAFADILKPGHRVLVPFGRRYVEGYVVRYPTTSSLTELKPIAKLLDKQPLLSSERVELARWMSERYLCLMAQAFQCWLPPGTALRSSTRAKARQENVYSLAPSAGDSQSVLEALRRAPATDRGLSMARRPRGNGQRLQTLQLKESLPPHWRPWSIKDLFSERVAPSSAISGENARGGKRTMLSARHKARSSTVSIKP